MGNRKNARVQTAPVVARFTYSDERLEHEFRRNLRGFETEVAALFAKADLLGQFGFQVSTKVKGSPDHKGLVIGSTVPQYRQVELFWQEQSYSDQFAIRVGTNRIDPNEFRKRIVAAMYQSPGSPKPIAPEVPKAPPAPVQANPKQSAQVINHPAKDRVSVLEELLPKAMAIICKHSPELGLTSREECFELFAEFGEHIDTLIEFLIEGKHLLPQGSSRSLFKASERWLKQTASAQPTPPAQASVSAPPPAPTPVVETQKSSSGNFLERLNELDKIMRKADQHKEKLQRFADEKAQIESLIRNGNERLAVINAEATEAEAFLSSSEYTSAEKEYLTAKKMFG